MSTQFNYQKHFYFKLFSSVKVLNQTIQFSISTIFVCTLLNVKTVLFHTIQFSISPQFSSIWPINRTLSGATALGHGRPGSNCNEGILCISQSSNMTRTSSSNCLVSYLGHSLSGDYPSAEKQLVYSTAPADWAIHKNNNSK